MLREKRYETIAELYDAVELGGDGETPLTNAWLIGCLREHGVKRIHDMACGTGAQAIALHRAGFDVVGSDLSEAMLRVARRKAGAPGIRFHRADMISVSLGLFDAVIAINNGMGHLTPTDLGKALRNAARNLRVGGILIFDVFNAPLVAHFPRAPVIDVAVSSGDAKYVRYSSFDFDAATEVLTVNQTTHLQEGFEPFRTVEESYQLQAYDAAALEHVIVANGFSRATVTGEGMREHFGDTGIVHFAVCFK